MRYTVEKIRILFRSIIDCNRSKIHILLTPNFGNYEMSFSNFVSTLSLPTQNVKSNIWSTAVLTFQLRNYREREFIDRPHSKNEDSDLLRRIGITKEIDTGRERVLETRYFSKVSLQRILGKPSQCTLFYFKGSHLLPSCLSEPSPSGKYSTYGFTTL